MKRLVLLAAALACFLPLLAADCNNGDGRFTWVVLGPENPANLWQFATVRGWKASASATVYPASHNHGRLLYTPELNEYAVDDSPCNFGLASPNGSTIVLAAEYVSDSGTVAQRAYIAAVSFAASLTPAPATATMAEVPPAAATRAAGTVTVTWADLPSQAAITGYRVVRSADGIAGWSTVADVLPGAQTAQDTPGSGTWYYAAEAIYLNDGTNKVVSPHGLAAAVIVP